MFFRLAYLAVTNTFAALRLLPMSDRGKDVEILAPRHQITVLDRQLGADARVRSAPADRAFLAALLTSLPPRGRCLLWNERHLRHALREYERFYNRRRAHQALNQAAPLRAVPEPIMDPMWITELSVRGRGRLAGSSMSTHMLLELRGCSFRQAQCSRHVTARLTAGP